MLTPRRSTILRELGFVVGDLLRSAPVLLVGHSPSEIAQPQFPSLLNGWVNTGGGWGDTAFYRAGDFVIFHGLPKRDENSNRFKAIFVLPDRHRPPPEISDVFIPATYSQPGTPAKAMLLSVGNDGVVNPAAYDGYNTSKNGCFIWLDGRSFRVV